MSFKVTARLSIRSFLNATFWMSCGNRAEKVRLKISSVSLSLKLLIIKQVYNA